MSNQELEPINLTSKKASAHKLYNLQEKEEVYFLKG